MGARCRGPFFSRAPAVPLFCAFLVATGSATLIAMFGTVSDKTYPMYAISKRVPGGLGLQPRLLPRAGRGQGGLLQAHEPALLRGVPVVHRRAGRPRRGGRDKRHL